MTSLKDIADSQLKDGGFLEATANEVRRWLDNGGREKVTASQLKEADAEYAMERAEAQRTVFLPIRDESGAQVGIYEHPYPVFKQAVIVNDRSAQLNSVRSALTAALKLLDEIAEGK